MNPTDEAIQKITAAIEAAIKGLGALGEKYGPSVVDSALWAVRIEGMNAIRGGLLQLILAFIAFVLGWYVAKHKLTDPKYIDRHRGLDDAPYWHIALFICLVVAISSVVGALIPITNLWNWTAIFKPEVWIAKKLMGL